MRRLFGPLIAVAIVASMALAGTGAASASTGARPAPLDAGNMARTYMTSAMLSCTHMSSTDFAAARAAGCSYRSIAASCGVDATQVVNVACARAQAVVSARVRKHQMTPSAARALMRSVRAYCVRYLGVLPAIPGSSNPTTATPGVACPGPWAPGTVPTSTPCVPTTTTPGVGCPDPWAPGTVPTSTPSVPSTVTPGTGRGPGVCW
jgi:hypothetical protein